MSPGAERIRQFVERKPGEKLTALLHHITPETLREAYLAVKRDAAPGVDGVRWSEYGDGLEERLLDLYGRVQRGAYRAKPVRRVEIPKPDGGVRSLGIVSLEDKIVQRAVVDNLLNPIGCDSLKWERQANWRLDRRWKSSAAKEQAIPCRSASRARVTARWRVKRR